MKLTISYRGDEQELVERLMQAAKLIFRIQREHKPKLGADGLYHAHMRS